MGVYVSEITMPKGDGSKLVLQIFPNGEVYDGHGIRLGITNWAEAVPVPPHGDLIDRAVLIDSFEPSDFWNSSAEDNCFAAIHVTNSMPTIIQAESAEEEMK